MTILISHVLKESHGNAGSFLFPCDLHQFPRAIKNKHCSVTSLAPNCHCKFIRYLTWATREGVDARSSYFVGVDDRPACGPNFFGFFRNLLACSSVALCRIVRERESGRTWFYG